MRVTADVNVVGFLDTDFAGDHEKGFLTGYVFTLSAGAFVWKATSQATGVLSITEIEYMVVNEAEEDASRLRRLAW